MTTERLRGSAEKTSKVREDWPSSREEWMRTRHAYEYWHPQYVCARCGLWPGAGVHQEHAP